MSDCLRGCCSSYMICSDNRECSHINSSDPILKQLGMECTYRLNLEAGRIFYGKNATTDQINKAGFQAETDSIAKTLVNSSLHEVSPQLPPSKKSKSNPNPKQSNILEGQLGFDLFS